ncbi:selenide, water dikinase SelD [Aliikangiella coralliicola]|uniref:Selenide, water dikinase n=1 Tax=Aliikangiella coralliicola TaxID=2592383 RepID=A0A545UH19_9GAMM|nr:selenide, water dikinase SelD [Aliikangiella coralliicola]TQV88768.1 selenide, water dikinase SelD [Aliikangiella coralliicola]
MSVKLTEYSHGAGCGCKIAPAVLKQILTSETEIFQHPQLLVGNETSDDAAVFDLGNGTSVISTTDFFMPIVDDPHTFGRIAATNAISDIYAMGGKPIMAIAILGWPVDKLTPDIAQKVVDGGRFACKEAGISLAGGHSIDSPEPIFGLAVTGVVDTAKILRNSTAAVGSELFLTKPLGVGIVSTAQKKKCLQPADVGLAERYMCELNKAGESFSQIDGVQAMTDVTGFGLFGHLLEICKGSGVSAEVNFRKVPVIAEAEKYRLEGAIPGGTFRNFESYRADIAKLTDRQMHYGCDPQTSGGLLVAVAAEAVGEFIEHAKTNGLELSSFGKLIEPAEKLILVSD